MIICVVILLMELFKGVQRKLTVTTGSRIGVYKSSEMHEPCLEKGKHKLNYTYTFLDLQKSSIHCLFYRAGKKQWKQGPTMKYFYAFLFLWLCLYEKIMMSGRLSGATPLLTVGPEPCPDGL